ncbi:MAG: pilus assembly protein [Alphaproteobacteria bacterium]|nr:pilus assembly protein [Alphaproteobacteria bacterium]
MRGDTRATTAVEFGIVAPLLFAVMFGILAFGIQFATRIAVTYAATEGGRAAIGGLDDTERESLARAAITRVLTALSPLVDPSKAAVNVVQADEASDHKIDISITYNDTRFALLPFVPDFSALNPVTVEYYVTDPSG